MEFKHETPVTVGGPDGASGSPNGSPTGNGDSSSPPQNGRHRHRRRPHHGNHHLKLLPDAPTVRETIKSAAETLAATLSKARPLRKDELVRLGRSLLHRTGQPETFLGFAMVLIGNSFWRSQFLATPFERRLLLLPPGVDHAASCGSGNSEESETGREPCSACALLRSQQRAERLGYRVLLADRSSVVLNTIVEGTIDGILGVARMDVLEKAIDKVLITGVPSYVVPLRSGTALPSEEAPAPLWHEEWFDEIFDRYEPQPAARTSSFVPLMRAANRLFTEDFGRLLPRDRSRSPERAVSPLGITEDVAYDWLANGGKRFRPFITLAAYDAAAGDGAAAISPEAIAAGRFPDSVCRVAMAIEAFHKASLVHDDIQDDDQFRYGRDTLHRVHGVGPAINIGDYLIGLGYRLVNSCYKDLGADVAAEIVHSMADAHIKLCDGQGAEMAWQFDPDWSLTPADALHIYALKTSPAFEAALHAGLRMAGPIDEYAGLVRPFASHLGIGFQVLNDLKDWQGDADNKLLAGQDALAIRPTMLLALALEAASASQQRDLREIYESHEDDALRLRRLLQLFSDLGAFDAAVALVDRSREQALALAQDVRPAALERLLCFLVDTVLARETPVPGASTLLREGAGVPGAAR
ncbi:MAG: polyprenyl synthetase family protein [Planctomycetaceae bacterium]